MAFLGGLFGDIKTSDVLTGVAERGAETVSYTHLTLPTIYSV